MSSYKLYFEYTEVPLFRLLLYGIRTKTYKYTYRTTYKYTYRIKYKYTYHEREIFDLFAFKNYEYDTVYLNLNMMI